MKKTDKINLKDRGIQELTKSLIDSRRQLAESRMKLSTGQLSDTSVIKKIKYQISLITTLISQKKS